ncbi:MAG: hypothetical protein AB7K04_08080, partial [Pseudorhodoplanes sp.]
MPERACFFFPFLAASPGKPRRSAFRNRAAETGFAHKTGLRNWAQFERFPALSFHFFILSVGAVRSPHVVASVL